MNEKENQDVLELQTEYILQLHNLLISNSNNLAKLGTLYFEVTKNFNKVIEENIELEQHIIKLQEVIKSKE